MGHFSLPTSQAQRRISSLPAGKGIGTAFEVKQFMKTSATTNEALEAKILKHVADSCKRGRPVRAENLLSSKSEQKWQADQFSIREAIWNLLASHRLELTSQRMLVPSNEDVGHANARHEVRALVAG